MMIKLSILAVAIIGIAAAGSFQNLFRPIPFPQLFGQPPVFFYQVAASTVPPAIATPGSPTPGPAPIPTTAGTTAPIPTTAGTTAPVPAAETTTMPATVTVTTVSPLMALEQAALDAGIKPEQTRIPIRCTTGTPGVPVRTMLTAGPTCVICFCNETVMAATLVDAVPATCRNETCPSPATLWTNAATFPPLPTLANIVDWTVYKVAEGYVYSKTDGSKRTSYLYATSP